MQFQHMRITPFDDEQRRRRLIRELNTIPGISIPEDSHRKRPSFDMNVMGKSENLHQFLGIMTAVLHEAAASI